MSFHAPITGEGVDAGAGHWALARYDDVHFASRHPDVFSSSPNITIGDQTPELAEYLRVDDRHGRPAAQQAAQYRAQRLHAQGARPHRGIGT